jgi:hypothetical protein
LDLQRKCISYTRFTKAVAATNERSDIVVHCVLQRVPNIVAALGTRVSRTQSGKDKDNLRAFGYSPRPFDIEIRLAFVA